MDATDNEEVKSKRDIVFSRLKVKYPNENLDDEETMWGKINDDYDGYEDELKTRRENEKSLTDMFANNPRSANFLMSWKHGEDPVVMLLKEFGTDIKEAIDDPEKQQAIAEANKEYVDRVAKNKQLEEEYQKNLETSLKNIADEQSKNGLTDEQVDNAMLMLINIVKDGVMGKFTPESIDIAMKAINHDKDVEAANMEGEIKGKNTKIDEKLRKQQEGDGTVPLSGKNQVMEPKKRNLGVLDSYGGQNIWERGGEKRTKY